MPDLAASAPPRLSVVVPLYNCLDFTRAMVASLRATLPPGLAHEIILVDDGSSDGTADWLATLGPPFVTVRNSRNLGYAAANNRGAARARGELLALLNNDLVLTPGWLEPMLRVHEGLGARAGAVGNVQVNARDGTVDHAGIVIDFKGKPEHDRSRPALWRRCLRPALRVEALTGACVLVSRKLWNEMGGFDEGYVNGCEDVDFCLRASAASRIHAVALRSVVRHHVSISPGRKLRDEANTYRLTQRWRDTLARLGLRAWCRHYLETYAPDPRDYPDQSLARQAVFYLARIRRAPPAGAVAGMHAAIEVELARWRALAAESAPEKGLQNTGLRP
jgi:GT2 family glycosyltransferase